MATQNRPPSQQQVGLEVSRYLLCDRGHHFRLRGLTPLFRERCRRFGFGQNDKIVLRVQLQYRELSESHVGPRRLPILRYRDIAGRVLGA